MNDFATFGELKLKEFYTPTEEPETPIEESVVDPTKPATPAKKVVPTVQIPPTNIPLKGLIKPTETKEVVFGEDEVEEQVAPPAAPPETPETPTTGDPALWESFNYIKEKELMHIPDDFEFDGTAEKLNELYQIDQDTRNQTAEQAFYGKFQDPKLQELFKYAQQAEGFANIPAYLFHQKKEDYFQKLDVTKEDQAKELITHYLELKQVPKFTIESTLEKAVLEDKLGELGKEAQTGILSYYDTKLEDLASTGIQQNQQSQQEQRQYQLNLQKAIASFPTTEKQAVEQLTRPVVTNQGTYQGYEIALWQLQQKPEMFAHLLHFLATFNPNKPKAPVTKPQTFAERNRGIRTPKGITRGASTLEQVIV